LLVVLFGAGGHNTLGALWCLAESGLLAILEKIGAESCYGFRLDRRQGHAVGYARVFNPTVGIVEDPATGTAAAVPRSPSKKMYTVIPPACFTVRSLRR
jgi:predicted PhzF superfamily epimerase YddE/YHI9